MIPTDFDNVFADLVDGVEDLRGLLQTLRRRLPHAWLELHGDDGVVVTEPAGGSPLAAEAATIAGLLEQALAGNELVAAQGRGGEWFYAVPLAKAEAVLVAALPGRQGNLLVEPHGRDLLLSAVDYALLDQEQQLLVIENQQVYRQINVHKQQYSALIEDNFRQYRLIQEKEKEYARKLESEIARQTAELRSTNARLEKASRLQNEFLANMSHELRTPMNAIIGFSELLSETDLDPDQSEYAKTIKEAAGNLLVLINDILDLAKIEAGKVELDSEPFALRELVEGVASLFRLPAAAKKVAFMVEIEEGLPALLVGDGNRLRQILINLVGNAMKFTDRGRVAIIVQAGRCCGEQVEVIFSVRDTGIGIAADRQQAIFDKFTQADGSTTRKYGGTGLGLAICSQLVKLMGGDIRVESVEGEGSSFIFSIPMASRRPLPLAPAAEAASVEADAPVGGVGALRILLVEDNPVNQRLASIIVSKQGCELAVASDGLEALAQLRAHPFDLVLMDVQMPNMDGLEATRKIREIEASPAGRAEYAGLRDRQRPLVIVGLTAHARKEDEQACYGVGMNGFLSKPIVKDRLVAFLREEAERLASSSS